MKVRIWRNDAPNRFRFKVAKLPVRQTLIWAGPVFVLVQKKRKVVA